MLSRAFVQLLGKGTKRPLDLFVQASSVFCRSSNMPQQLHHLHRQPEPTDGSPPKQHPFPNNSSEATCTRIFESNWTMRRCFSTVDNSDDIALDSVRGAVGQNLVQKLATLKSIGDCVSDYDLSMLLKKKTAPVCYVWCDPSPLMHITQGLSMTINVNRMINAGFKVKVLIADWFARMDSRIGGNLSKMHTVALYNIEMWKATGMDLDSVEFVLLSDEISGRADEYWPLAMHIASASEMGDIARCSFNNFPKDTWAHGSIDPGTIREITPAETLYACLQCASMLLPEVDVWLLGMDQRGANMLAGEYCKLMGRDKEPLALFYNTVRSFLQHPEWKELEDPVCSIIYSRVYMEDDEESVSSKIKNAFCPPKLVEDNPCLEYVKYIILPWFGKFEVILKEENGGMKTFLSMDELTADYSSGAVRPASLKQALVKAINIMLKPVRDHFRSHNAEAKKLAKAMEEFYIIDKANGQHLVS